MKEFMTEGNEEDSSIEYIIIENGEEKMVENEDIIESASRKDTKKNDTEKIDIKKSQKRKFQKETTNQKIASQKISKELVKEIMEYVLIFLIALIVMLLLNNFIIINARIPSASMEDTVMTGDRLIGNRLAYKNDIPQRFDVIIFKFPDNESELYIKRIIGLPGETVTITGGKVYINDSTTPLDDSFTKEIPATTSFGPYYVPSNSYFVMGDNRNNSYDSRYWSHTFVKSEQILGKAMFRYYPFNKISKVD